MTGVGVAHVLAAEMTSETSGVIAALVATGAAGKTALLTDTACSQGQLPLLGLCAWTCLALHGHWVRFTALKTLLHSGCSLSASLQQPRVCSHAATASFCSA